MNLSKIKIPIENITVNLGPRSYDILIAPSIIDNVGDLIAKRLETVKAIIISDTNVAPIYMKRLSISLNAAGINNDKIILPAGESTKSFGNFESLLNKLLELGIERTTTLIALGGGVIGDITGFAASSLLRGINYVQVPTSLLAQVDSSVGGKTAINTKIGKNLIGSFYQPRLVIADTETLNTLPNRELLAGYAETVKYALLGDASFFSWLELNGTALIRGNQEVRVKAIAKSCEMKARIVAEDERESGKRALLNLGHTFAHALEAETGFNNHLLHGEAVAIGIVLAFELSSRLSFCSSIETTKVRNHLQSVGLSIAPPKHPMGEWNSERLIALMKKDKKAAQGHPAFVLVRSIGDAFIADDVDLNAVESLLKDILIY